MTLTEMDRELMIGALRWHSEKTRRVGDVGTARRCDDLMAALEQRRLFEAEESGRINDAIAAQIGEIQSAINGMGDDG